MTDEEKVKLNIYPLEPSGLVSDPIPQSKRPTRRLSETGELRLGNLVDELQEEVDRKQRAKRAAEVKAAEERAAEEKAAEEMAAEDGTTGTVEPNPMDANDAAVSTETLPSEPEQAAEAAGSVLVASVEESVGEPKPHKPREPKTPQTSLENPVDPATLVSGMLADLVAEAEEAAAAEKESAEAAERPAEDFEHKASSAPVIDDKPQSTFTPKGTKGKKKRPPMDPWLEDVLDEQEAQEQSDFSKYQGQFARLNDFAVVKTDTELARENAIAAKQKEAAEFADEQAKIENGEVGFISPAGYRIIPSEDLRDVTEDEVSVHSRELLASATYDELINWGTRLARETPLFYRAFSIGDVSTVCDVGCGSGRHSIMFAEWGHKVVGMDESGAILKRARVLAKESDDKIMQANGEVRFEKGGLGNVARIVGPQRVEAVVCVGDILPRVGSMEELRDALDDFADALLPSGVLVLEFSNHTRYVNQSRRTTDPVVFDTAEGTKVFMSVIDYEQENELMKTDMLTLSCGRDNRWHVRCERVKYLFISPDVIAHELLEAGFDIIELSGDFNGKSLSPTEDESIVVIARRKRHRPVAKRKRTVYP